MMTTIRIVDDASIKRAVIEQCDRAFSTPLAPRSNKEAIISKIIGNAVFIAAYDGEDAVGYAAIYANDTVTKTAFITMFGVVEEMRGRHVGSALMQCCIDQAIAHGMTRIRLEVLKSEAVPITFYERCGFSYDGDCTDASIYMLRELP